MGLGSVIDPRPITACSYYQRKEAIFNLVKSWFGGQFTHFKIFRNTHIPD